VGHAHGVGLLLLVAVGFGGLALTAGTLIAWRARRGRLARGFLAGLVGMAGLYLATRVTVSAASQPQVLAPGEVKRFCGFYLDCHLGVSVDDVRTARSLGAPSQTVTATGTFRIVTLRISSDARRATLAPYGLLAVVVDEQGRRYPRDRAAERALLGPDADRPLEREVAAGDSYTRTLVFDLPADAARPALSVTQGALPDVLIEWFLIGDEDSLFHKPTLLGLAPIGAIAPRT